MNRDKDTWPCAGWQKARNGTFFIKVITLRFHKSLGFLKRPQKFEKKSPTCYLLTLGVLHSRRSALYVNIKCYSVGPM